MVDPSISSSDQNHNIPNRPYVFVSYSRKDREYKNRFVSYTIKTGFEVWNDKDIPLGKEWFGTIVHAIKHCTVFIVIMTQQAEQSEWIRKEILHAIKYKKTIIGVLLQGEVFDILIDVQCEDMRGKEKNGKMLLPGSEFYQQLEMYLPKNSIDLQPWNTRQTYDNVPRELPSELYEELARWEQYREEGVTDFYGIAMLALAYEGVNTFRAHRDAIKFFKKAYCIEPRILYPLWMSEHFGWTEKQEILMRKILHDPAVIKFLSSRGR
jgi:hypothetical protein